MYFPQRYEGVVDVVRFRVQSERRPRATSGTVDTTGLPKEEGSTGDGLDFVWIGQLLISYSQGL